MKTTATVRLCPDHDRFRIRRLSDCSREPPMQFLVDGRAPTVPDVDVGHDGNGQVARRARGYIQSKGPVEPDRLSWRRGFRAPGSHLH
jgi:hypothetical protein